MIDFQMHALGKFFLFLVVVGSIGAVFMSTRAYDIRNSWMKEADKYEKEVETNRNAAEKSAVEREKLTYQFETLARPWQAYWTGIKVDWQPGAESVGGLLVQLGMPQLKQPEDATHRILVHAFQPVPGSDTPGYVGEFRVDQLAEGQSVLMPNWIVRPDELQQWVVGENWHFREAIPAGDKSLIGSLETQLTEGYERLMARQAELAQTEEIILQTQKVLDRRVEEIEGIADAAEKSEKLPVEYVAGLQQTILDEEDAVNAATAEVQRLRDELFDVQQRIDELREEIDAELRKLESAGSQVQASLTPGE